jgi:hypothetical protein
MTDELPEYSSYLYGLYYLLCPLIYNSAPCRQSQVTTPFWTVSIVLDSKNLRNYNVSVTGSVSILRFIKLSGGRRLKWYKTYTVGSLRKS